MNIAYLTTILETKIIISDVDKKMKNKINR